MSGARGQQVKSHLAVLVALIMGFNGCAYGTIVHGDLTPWFGQVLERV